MDSIDGEHDDSMWQEALEGTPPLCKKDRVQFEALELSALLTEPIAMLFLPNDEIPDVKALRARLAPVIARAQRKIVEGLAELPGIMAPAAQSALSLNGRRVLMTCDSADLPDDLPAGADIRPLAPDEEAYLEASGTREDVLSHVDGIGGFIDELVDLVRNGGQTDILDYDTEDENDDDEEQE